jgi:small subunit ribosomal protein S17
LRKIRVGVVVSNKMHKTVTVRLERVYQHALFQKIVRSSSKVLAHDEENKAVIGDLVEIIETRPLSKRKNWRVVRIIGKGKAPAIELPKKRETDKQETEAII